MTPLHLRIRGLLALDDVDLDLGLDGLVVVVGPNGAGKSTLLDAVPAALYRELPGRPRPLAEYATRRDSYLELVLEHAGAEWRLVHLFGSKPTSYAYRDGIAMTDHGRARDFDDVIAAHFPSKEVFFASVYAAQGGVGDFARLRDLDRREILAQVLGLDELERRSQAAGEQRRQHDAQALALEATRPQLLARLAGAAPDLAALAQAAEDAGHGVDVADSILAEAHEAATTAREGVAALASRRAQARAVEERRAQAERAVQAAAARLREAEGQAVPVGSVEALLAEAEASLEAARQLERESSSGQRAAELAIPAIPTLPRPDTVRREIERARASTALIGEVPCGGGDARHIDERVRATYAGCPLLREALTSRRALPAIVRSLAEAEAAWGAHEVADQVARRAAQATAVASAGVAEAYQRTDTLRARLERGRLARERIAQRVQELEAARLVHLELIGLGSGLDLEGPHAQAVAAARQAQDALAAAQRGAQEARAALVEARARLAHAQAAQAARSAAEGELEGLGRRLAEVGQRRAGWALLEAALGRRGLQALEVDAAAPAISSVASDLLAACYGSRFRVELSTLREAEGNRQAREAIDLVVTDGRDGQARRWEDLSGGERTVVSEALKLAIAVYGAQRTGGLSTLWRDESDGALDPERAAAYPAMLRVAMELGGFDRVFFVSHRPEVQAQADYQIVVGGGHAACIAM